MPKLNLSIVAGAANNQLASAAAGRLLHERGILYAPDYVINAGGMLNVAAEIAGGYDRAAVERSLARIPASLLAIFSLAAAENRPTSDVADAMAQQKLAALRGIGTPQQAA